MQSSLRFETVASRFQPFIEELHRFFDECAVAYGSPVDLPCFCEELRSRASLRLGLGSKIRGILRRVQKTVSHGDLVELVLVAVGGTEVEEETPAVQSAERLLSQIVGEVMTSRVSVSYTQTAIVDGAACDHAAAEASVFDRPDEGAEEAVVKKKVGPEIFVWASPPSFVWAALVCGALLAPCMYLLSKAHGVAPKAPQGATVPPAHATVFTPPNYLMPWSLNDVLSPAPNHSGVSTATKKRPHSDLPIGIEASNSNTAGQQSPATVTGTLVRPTPPADNAARDTDMPGRDRDTSPLPATPNPQPGSPPER